MQCRKLSVEKFTIHTGVFPLDVNYFNVRMTLTVSISWIW